MTDTERRLGQVWGKMVWLGAMLKCESLELAAMHRELDRIGVAPADLGRCVGPCCKMRQNVPQ